MEKEGKLTEVCRQLSCVLSQLAVSGLCLIVVEPVVGMLKAAMRIRAEIEKYGHLAWAMNRDHSRQEAEQGHRHNQNQRQNNSNSNNQNQNQGEGQGQGQGQEQSRSPASRQLVVVGHSLGAGTAVLLSFLLRRAYPHLRCFTYGTPGSMLDPVTARECASWVTSCVLGHDLVCRLSFKALSDLRAEVHSLLFAVVVALLDMSKCDVGPGLHGSRQGEQDEDSTSSVQEGL